MMTSINVISTPVPAAARASCGIADIDFADAYCGHMQGAPANATRPSAEQAARAMFENPPRLAIFLMRLRNAVVSLFGLKSDGNMAADATRRVGIFPIVSVTPREIVLGLDDKHLDFRIWISVQESSADTSVTMATMVHFNNLFGKLYLWTILPFHILLTRMMLKRGLASLGRP